MKLVDKTCWLCNSTEWINVDYLRTERAGMVVCKGCGLVTFNRFSCEDEYHTYYEEQYRQVKTVATNNLVTTNRKVGYHDAFLTPYLKEKQNGTKKPLIVGEIGTGTGYFLRWMRDVYGAEVLGCELTSTFRRYAKWAFDIDLTKEFDFSKKYDLIAIYHTLEHVPNPKELLLKLRECLNEGGVLYIAAPVWMEEMQRWGGGAFTTFDDHFHPDHINAWSRWHLKALFRTTGWQIVKEQNKMYGHTVILERTEVCQSLDTPPQTHEQVVEQLTNMKKAVVAYQAGQYKEAISIYPQFVDAYLAQAGGEKDSAPTLELFALGENCCPNTSLFNASRGLHLYQQARYDEAERELATAISLKPGDDNLLLHLAIIYIRRAEQAIKQDLEKGKSLFRVAVNILDKIIAINPTQYQQCYDLIGFIFSTIPIGGEEAVLAPPFTAPHAEGAPHITITGQE